LNGILDSLGIIELVKLISDEYYIKFDANDLALENFKNIDSIFLLITSKS
jgi:acyl carrier protein